MCLVLGVPCVAAATVSTGSGTDTASEDIARRAAVSIETMEGAALASACDVFGLPWIGVRAISNRTGNRDEAGWDLDTACATLSVAVIELLARLRNDD